MSHHYNEILGYIENALPIARDERDQTKDENIKKTFVVIVDQLASARHNIRHHILKEKCDCVYGDYSMPKRVPD